ncbi:AAA family ATPase [Pseudofrankia sp. BMG5.37]|uniref:AAA family ATPase n=1 Tax=Pseudofrankia sp. BMG5.37 TaxID=3050035 RepID=UPI002893E407|nr:AAA family ATPase [Pseudofrankia sp. BMG5.37]MDT3444005.1 AAA family ATPase [Pseudofrankia sp. BMG5.37]
MTASLDDALPSRKEGWILLAESGPRVAPKRLTRAALDALSPAAKAAHDRARRVWHANIGPLRTAQMMALHDDLWDIVETNHQDGDKAKGAAAIDGYPGLGKTTAALVFAREFHRRQIAEEGRFTVGGHEHLPVCWIGLGANTTIKGLNRTILDFYAHPAAAGGYRRATTTQLASQAHDCIVSCRTRLIVVDFTDRG